jgi:hypothetical protein
MLLLLLLVMMAIVIVTRRNPIGNGKGVGRHGRPQRRW